MSINALVAVHPDIDVQFDDAEVMGVLPVPTRNAIASAKSQGRNFKGMMVSATEYIVYNVYGSPDDLAAAIAEFGVQNITPLGSWNKDGTRYGTSVNKTYDTGELPATINVPASDIVPTTYTVKRWEIEVVEVDGRVEGEKEPASKKVLKTYVKNKGEVLDFEGNVLVEGRKDIIVNSQVVESVTVDSLNPDGSFDYQPHPITTMTETTEGTPSIPLHPLLMGTMPDDVIYDGNGNGTGRNPSSTFKDVRLKFGQSPRVFT